MLEVMEWLLILLNQDITSPSPLNWSMGIQIMVSFSKYQFKENPGFTKGSQRLVRAGLVATDIPRNVVVSARTTKHGMDAFLNAGDDIGSTNLFDVEFR